jgi:hypothetical protein
LAEQLTLHSAKEKLQRLRSQLSNVKESAQAVARLGTDSLVVVAGGAAAGALAAKMPLIPNTQIPTVGAVGSAIVALAMSGVMDDQADRAALFGAGMLAAMAARETEKILTA